MKASGRLTRTTRARSPALPWARPSSTASRSIASPIRAAICAIRAYSARKPLVVSSGVVVSSMPLTTCPISQLAPSATQVVICWKMPLLASLRALVIGAVTAPSTAPLTALQASPIGLPPPTIPPVTGPSPPATDPTAPPMSQSGLALATGGEGWAHTISSASDPTTSAQPSHLGSQLIALQAPREVDHAVAAERPRFRRQPRRRPEATPRFGDPPAPFHPDELGMGEAEVGGRFHRSGVAEQGEAPGEDAGAVGGEGLDPVADRDRRIERLHAAADSGADRSRRQPFGAGRVDRQHLRRVVGRRHRFDPRAQDPFAQDGGRGERLLVGSDGLRRPSGGVGEPHRDTGERPRRACFGWYRGAVAAGGGEGVAEQQAEEERGEAGKDKLPPRGR